MKKIICLVSVFAFCGLAVAADKFDALNVAPTATPAPTALPVVQLTDTAASRLRDTYKKVMFCYLETRRDIELADHSSLSPAQWTEVVTVQWQLYNILKSINPGLDVPAPGGTVDGVKPKPTATPKKK